MRHRFTVLASVSLLLATGAVNASSTELQVAGTIAAGAACEMKVGDGAVDLGRLNRGDLNPDPSLPTVLPTQKIRMYIDCESPRRYATIASASHNVSGDSYDFGLRSDSDQTTTGSLHIRFDSSAAKIDGARGYYTATDTPADLGNAAWGPSTFSIMPVPNGIYAIGFVTEDGSDQAPKPIKNFYTDLLVSAAIRPTSELDLSDEISVIGELGFEVRYF